MYKSTKSAAMASLVAVSFIGAGASFGASYASKGGLATSTYDGQQSSASYGASHLPMLAPGVQELSLGGHLNWEDDTDYSLRISYGRFVTQNWLIGVQAGLAGVNSDKSYELGVFGEYNFLTGTQWVPFVRAGLGYSHPNQGDDSAAVGLDAGVKYFMRSNLAIYASVGGDWIISGDDSGDDGFAKQIDLGLKFYF